MDISILVLKDLQSMDVSELGLINWVGYGVSYIGCSVIVSFESLALPSLQPTKTKG